MKPTNTTEYYDKTLEELDDLQDKRSPRRVRGLAREKMLGTLKINRKKHLEPPVDALADQGRAEAAFNFTYQASRHERAWIEDSLGSFRQQQWLDDVVGLVKGGKEATVYLCAAHATTGAEFLAAKVYRPRMFRNLKNDAVYRQGRANLDSDGRKITDDGMLHAIQKKTGYGWELTHTSWIEYEYQTLLTLYEAGADVPRPYARGNNAILMEYLGEPGSPAPVLASVELERSEARRLFDRVVMDIGLMLAHNRVHGDLSAFNILYWDGAIHLIDFPQVIDADGNPDALRIFERDVARVAGYFARQGVRADPRRLAARLWTDHHRSLLPPIDPLLLDGEEPADRRAWELQVKNTRST